MEKNNENNDKQAVSKAVAHEMENTETVYATEYQAPPPLFLASNPQHIKEEVEGEEKDQKFSPSEVTDQADQVNSPDPVGADMSSDALTVQPNAPVKEDEKEEEIMDGPAVDLLFADDTPEPPNDEGEEENGAAGSGDGSGSGGDDDEGTAQRKPATGAAENGASQHSQVPQDVMSKMEASFGASFSNVKISPNSQKAKDSKALAYTQGNEIHFAPGQFKPKTNSGQKLLGHELAHVVQQRKGKVKPTTSINGMAVNDDPALERAADIAGEQAANYKAPVQKKEDPSASMPANDIAIQQKSEESADSSTAQLQQDQSLFEELSAESGNLIRSIAEISRLVPGLGIITGGLAQAINFEQDHSKAVEEAPGDDFLLALVDFRNSINLVNGLVDDLLYLNQVIGDCGGHATGITELIGLVGGGMNVTLDSAQVTVDLVTTAYTATASTFPGVFNVENVSTYEDFAFGYAANTVADTVGLVLGIIDTATLATGQGSIAERLGDGFFAMTRLQQVVRIIARKLADPKEVFGLLSSVIIGVNGGNLTQGAHETVFGEGENSLSFTREAIAIALEQQIGQVETVWDMGAGAVDYMGQVIPQSFEHARAQIMQLCDGVDPVIWIRDKMVEGIDEATIQAEQMFQNAQLMVESNENLEIVLMQLTSIGSEIENFTLPTDLFPDHVEVGDGPGSDLLEGVLDAGADLANSAANDLIAEIQAKLDEFKVKALEKINEAKEVAFKISLVVKTAQQMFLDAYRQCLDIIENFNGRLREAESLEDFLNVALGTVAEVLGIEGGLSVESLSADWQELKIFMDGKFDAARDLVNELVRNEAPAQPKLEGETTQLKGSGDSPQGSKSDATSAFEQIFNVELPGFEGLPDVTSVSNSNIFDQILGKVNHTLGGVDELAAKPESIFESLLGPESALNQLRGSVEEHITSPVLDQLQNLTQNPLEFDFDLGTDFNLDFDLDQLPSVSIPTFQLKSEDEGSIVSAEPLEPIQKKEEENALETTVEAEQPTTETSQLQSDDSEVVQKFDWTFGLGGAVNDYKQDHYNRNQFNQAPLQEPVDDPDWRLLPDSQSIYHQNGEEGAGNRKYVSTNGGNFEAVYDVNGQLVTDDANMGTYNYSGPDDTTGHLVDDVIPYWLFGNNENDDTPFVNRVAGPRIMERTGDAIGSGVRAAGGFLGNVWDNTGGRLFGSDDAAQPKLEDSNQTSDSENIESSVIQNMDAEEDVQMKEAPTQFKVVEEEEEVQMKAAPAQMKEAEEEEEIQMKEASAQFKIEEEEEEELQMKEAPAQFMIGDEKDEEEVQFKTEDNTTQLKEGEESEASQDTSEFGDSIIPSGVSVHKESSKAKEMGALAFAQGSDIHFAPGQYNPETRAGQELIGHELGHVAQQKAGRVEPTTQRKGVNVNDDSGLEKEADDFGVKFADSLQNRSSSPVQQKVEGGFSLTNPTLQKKENPDVDAPLQLKEAAGGSSEGTGPISVDGSQTVVKDLLSSQPLPLFDKVKTAPATLNAALSSESSELNSSFPNIEQPTGLENQPLAENTTEQAPHHLGYAGQGGSGEETVRTTPEVNRGPNADLAPQASAMPPSPVPTANVAPPPSTSVSIGDENIDYSAGPRPEVETSGEADPQQMTTQETQDTGKVTRDKDLADLEVDKDHGEEDIYPHYAELENLTPEVEMPQGQQIVAPQFEELTQKSAEIDAGFNAQAQSKLDKDLAEHKASNDAEVEKMTTGSQEEWTTYETSKTEEEARVKAEQEAAQTAAKTEVTTQQQTWKEENEAVKKQFVDDAALAKTDYQGKIDTEIEGANTDVENTFNQAEIDAQKEADDAQREADAKEAEADTDGGFNPIGWAVDQVKKGLDWLKDQFNKIIDWLKEAVAAIIEAAKTVANTIIEAARNAVTRFIEAFGEFLKTLVDIAFAAFPEIRDRIKDAIDTVVETAVEAVNQLADALKDFVNALLDALGKALTFLLDAYQKFINALLSIIEFLVVGLYELYKGLTNLALSAKQSPGHFMGQLQEEFLGMNLNDKLPFERDAHPDPSYFRPPTEGEALPDMGDNMPPVLEKNPLSEGDIEVQSITEAASPELSEDFMTSMPNDGEREFGGSGVDELDLLRQAYATSDSESGTPPEDAVEMNPADAYPYAHLADDPHARADAELDTFLGNQPAPEGGSASKDSGGAKADSGAIDDSMKIGPFTAGQRFRYLRTQMWNGITSWFNANKVAIIAGIVAAVVVGIALIIASGGAVLSLIPPLMTVLGAFFLGEALVKAGGYLKNFLTKAWGGGAGLADGAKDFARAMVIMVVELIFILLFDLNTVIKAAKAGLKGSIKMAMQGAKNTGKTLVRAGRETVENTTKSLARVGNGALNLVQGGTKIAATGLKSGFSRGVKTVSGLMDRVKSLKFKKFKLVRQGMWFKLYGKVNPWVLLASGRIVDVETKGGVKVGQQGDFIVKNGDELLQQGDEVTGILIGGQKNSSSFVDDLAQAGDEVAAAEYQGLLKQINASPTGTANIRGSGLYRNPNFRANFFKSDPLASKLSINARRFLSIHHVVPNSVRGLDGAHDLLTKLGRSIDEVGNAIALPRVNINQLDQMIKALSQGTGDANKLKAIIDEFKLPNLSNGDLQKIIDELAAFRSRAIHNDYHSAYTARIKKAMDGFVTEFNDYIKAGASEADALAAIGPKIDNYIDDLFTGLMDGTSNILK